MLTNSIAQSVRISAVLAMLLPAAALAQTPDAGSATDAPAAVPATEPVAPDAPTTTPDSAGGQVNPHALLDGLSGGPQGSPTAQRGNPQPGTSTSIPTTNPATIRPIEQRGVGNENLAVEDTGIQGQCDPVVSLGCPTIADQLQAGTTAPAADEAQDATQPETDATDTPDATEN